MGSDLKYEVLHSDQVKRIINLPPPKLLRWGTTILAAIFVFMLVFASIIRYPDVVPSPVEITTENPPVSLESRISGRISEIYVQDKDTVTAKQVIAAMGQQLLPVRSENSDMKLTLFHKLKILL